MVRENYAIWNCNCRFYWVILAALGLLIINGLMFARYMEHEGHWVTGMNNQVVWGLPHVFAIFLIVTASGVLNVASISSVFDKAEYKVWARLSGLLAIALLIGGLIVLVLDLGRPDRLIIAMTHYNFKSIFAWNIILYIGFILVVIIYLWMLFEPRMNRYSKTAGIVAFAWRIVLTTGTGAIFGIIIARQAYHTLMMVPLFIAMSLSFGTAFFVLYLAALRQNQSAFADADFLRRLGRLIGVFVSIVLLLTAATHGMKYINIETREYEIFILFNGGIYTTLLWAGQVVIGSCVPLMLIYFPGVLTIYRLVVASFLVVTGGFAQLCVVIIGGQVFPLILFPGKQISSSFYDGVIVDYIPSLAEISLGITGVASAIFISLLVLRVLPFLPKALSFSSKS